MNDLDLGAYRRRWIDRTYTPRDFADLLDEVTRLRHLVFELNERPGRSREPAVVPGGDRRH